MRSVVHRIWVLVVLAALALLGVLSAPGHGAPAVTPEPVPKNVLALLSADKDFSTLVLALKTAGLAGALEGKGPYTLLAPTNAAFDKLGKDQLAELLKDKPRLSEILRFHVLAARVSGEQLGKLDRSPETMLEARFFHIEKPEGVLTLYGVPEHKARVVSADRAAGNGLVHAIDAVMLPPPRPARGNK